jgi:hypothetical protein
VIRSRPEEAAPGPAGGREHDPLARVVERETWAEIVRALTPYELFVADKRQQGYTDAEIAHWLGVDASTVSRWMVRAQRRIARTVPGAAALLQGRCRPKSTNRGKRPGVRRRRRAARRQDLAAGAVKSRSIRPAPRTGAGPQKGGSQC